MHTLATPTSGSLPDSLAHWFTDPDDAATQHRVLLERSPDAPSLRTFGVLGMLVLGGDERKGGDHKGL